MSADVLERACILADEAQYELCSRVARPLPVRASRTPGLRSPKAALASRGGDTTAAPREARFPPGDLRRYITHVQHPKKGPMPVLKMMQTNACANDCFYCGCRAGRDFRRESFSPDELARLADQLHRARVVEGLFLSSGVVGRGDYTMERIVATAEILRSRYEFAGYLHLKIMPGASDAAIARAIAVSDRVSVNLEAPTPEHLARLTSTKDLASGLIEPLRRAQAIATASGRRVSRTTQYVVGAAGESDAEILDTTQRLYREVGLSRTYYSTFTPVPDTPLDHLPPEDPLRQHRLYQADFLLRQYRWQTHDLTFNEQGNLDLRQDPKLMWAKRHPEAFPVEINRATRHDLLRVPGFGPRTVEALLQARRHTRITQESALRRLGVATNRALPYVTIAGRTPPHQLPLPELADET